MKRSAPLLIAAIVVAVLLLGLSVYLRSWGGVVLVAVATAVYAWYRVQVARGEAAEQFFGDLGEETRLTNFQGASPSEMADERRPPARPPEAR